MKNIHHFLGLKMCGNAKLKRRFGQTEGHDRKQVNEASESYKMENSKMADLSVVSGIFISIFVVFYFNTQYHFI